VNADLYLWAKAFHIGAAITFLGGILSVWLFLATMDVADGLSEAQLRAIGRIHRWDQLVTTPAMLAVWILGLTLAMGGGWFPTLWLGAKLVLVLGLSGLHGAQSGTLRRLARASLPPPRSPVWIGPAIVGASALIALLVVLKPR